MSLSALGLSPEVLKKYCPLDASAAASQNKAKFLQSEFGDKEVIFFRSLVRRAGFSRWSELDHLRKFRHVVRNAYTHHLDSVQPGEFVKRSTFARFLEQQSDATRMFVNEFDGETTISQNSS